jgi:hypothetical protein
MNRQRFPIPASPAPQPGLQTFVAVPPTCLPNCTSDQQQLTQELYRLALEQVEAVLRPSLPERDLLAVWN